MEIIKIDLKKEYEGLENCEVTAFLHVGNAELPLKPRRAMVVVAGGGYNFVSYREAEPVALEFFNRGYNCFFITYCVAPARYPAALLQVSSLIDHIKKHASEYSVIKDKVFAIGFSAGGHLVGNVVAAKCNCNLLDSALREKIENLDSSLAGIALCYPVINIRGHYDSYYFLLGEKPENLLKSPTLSYLNLDSCVTSANPPAFIWCTANDTCVNASSALSYALSLNEKNITYELHIYKDGIHGLSLADDRVYATPRPITPNIKNWISDADLFLQSL